jgi:formylglycine-generating enzyme required for sulfatase activity
MLVVAIIAMFISLEQLRVEKEAQETRVEREEEKRAVTEQASGLAGEFVDIPGGTYQMGCSPGDSECEDDERPAHTVSIKPFRMGKYEVTVGQFRRFVEGAGYRTDAERGGNCWAVQADSQWAEQAGRDWRNPGFPQTDRHPVMCVSWNDAEAYVQWLSRQGVGRYRLPSESEWEYAARAGGSKRHSFGDGEGMLCQYGNIADRTAQQRFKNWIFASCDDGALYTAPVGGYRPNRFGLHDMQGNVWEWAADCYHDSHAGAPSDGAAWTAGDCADRVFRGGSWDGAPWDVRASYRSGLTSVTRNAVVGFRLLQDR